jgi:hypothetical protein
MRNVNSTIKSYVVEVTFPAWCDAEGIYQHEAAAEVAAHELAASLRRKYPPCSIRILERTTRVAYGCSWEEGPTIVAELSRTSNWSRPVLKTHDQNA